MPSPTLLDVSRWQFAITVAFHMTFPAITVGLSVFLAVVYGLYMRTGNTTYLQMFRFWKRIFAVGFGLGVVAGTVLTFEFGLNWGEFAARTGPILGPIIGMEVVTAFFVEAGFIGVMLYGEGRVAPRVMLLSCCMVALGTLLSTTWILMANSWMQTPAGYREENGRFVPVDWTQIMFNPSFGWRFPHMLLAVLISAAILVAAVGAYHLRRGSHEEFARRTLSIGLGIVALLLPIQMYVGDGVGDMVGKYQLSKLTAMEGNWDSTNTGWNAFVIPDQNAQRNRAQLTVPEMGSWIGKDLSGHTPVPGQDLIPRDQQPNSWPTFWGFRIMYYTAQLLLAAALAGVVLRLRGKLYTAPRFHRFVTWLAPAGIIAIIGGWVLAETGRQPYVVYGKLLTAEGVSELASGAVVASLAVFAALYGAMLALWIGYVVRCVRRGPDAVAPAIAQEV
ncbi:cytochrome ubiquinol oxidase subunit I [Nocardia sp. NBC_00511]|uniref:cytochrome ubiquinol oxidase subunit I n=1 Tax=Nocardia sp. NBC_00511 TaxID=2903591 RepID=UPI0030DE9594